MTEREAGAVDRGVVHLASEVLDTAARLPVYAELRVIGEATPEEISDEMGMGVERVRESLRQLENEGIVEEERGTYAAITPTETVKNLPYAFRVRVESVLNP